MMKVIYKSWKLHFCLYIKTYIYYDLFNSNISYLTTELGLILFNLFRNITDNAAFLHLQLNEHVMNVACFV